MRIRIHADLDPQHCAKIDYAYKRNDDDYAKRSPLVMNLVYTYSIGKKKYTCAEKALGQKDGDGLAPTTAFDNCRNSIIFYLCQSVLYASFCKLFTKFFPFNT